MVKKFMSVRSILYKGGTYNPSQVLSVKENIEEYEYMFGSKGDLPFDETQVESLFGHLMKSVLKAVGVWEEDRTAVPHVNTEHLRYLTQGIAGLEGCLSAYKMYSGDWYNGLYGTMLSVLGIASSRTGVNPDMLKTFVVISFINGCVQVLDASAFMLSGATGAPPAHVIYTIAAPILSMAVTFAGWEYITVVKHRYAFYQYQYLCMLKKHQLSVDAMANQNARMYKPRLAPVIEEPSEHESSASDESVLPSRVVDGATGGSGEATECVELNDHVESPVIGGKTQRSESRSGIHPAIKSYS